MGNPEPLGDLVAMITARYGVDHQGRCACDGCERERGELLARRLRMKFELCRTGEAK